MTCTIVLSEIINQKVKIMSKQHVNLTLFSVIGETVDKKEKEVLERYAVFHYLTLLEYNKSAT